MSTSLLDSINSEKVGVCVVNVKEEVRATRTMG